MSSPTHARHGLGSTILGTEDFFSLISNTAGGYSFYKGAKFRRITRSRYNDVPMDNRGRYFFIKDGDTAWSPGWKPVKTPLDRYGSVMVWATPVSQARKKDGVETLTGCVCFFTSISSRFLQYDGKMVIGQGDITFSVYPVGLNEKSYNFVAIK